MMSRRRLAIQGDNPHAVRYYSAWEEDDVIYIQTELCLGNVEAEWKGGAGGDGNAGRTPLSEARLCVVAAHAAAGLAHMHRHGMVHLDVKPSNLYVSMSGHVKLGDFGNTRSAESFSLAADGSGPGPEAVGLLPDLVHGDRKYVAPEVLGIEARTVDEAGWYAADIFSLGLSLYELASCEPLPAQGHGYARLRSGDAPSLHSASPAFSALVASMIDPDPRKRPSAGASRIGAGVAGRREREQCAGGQRAGR